MKKLTLVIAIVFCLTIPAIAADTFTTTFTWEQVNAADLPFIAEWRCREVNTGQVVVFPNTGGTWPFVATSDFTLTGEPGQTVTHDYQIQAVALDGYETPWSITKSKSYTLTGAQIGVPVLISVE